MRTFPGIANPPSTTASQRHSAHMHGLTPSFAPEGAPEWSAHNGQTKADGSPRHLRGALIGWGSVIRWFSSACVGLDRPATFPQPAGLKTHRAVSVCPFRLFLKGFRAWFSFPAIQRHHHWPHQRHPHLRPHPGHRPERPRPVERSRWQDGAVGGKQHLPTLPVMKKDPHRQFCQRQHRLVGHYLALQAWLRGLDCIVLNRANLMCFFHLDRFKSARIKWLQSDLKPWFPHQEPYYNSSSQSSIHSLFLSRVPIESHLPAGTMTTPERIRRMAPGSPRTESFIPQGVIAVPPSEDEMLRELTLLATGLAMPKVFNP